MSAIERAVKAQWDIDPKEHLREHLSAAGIAVQFHDEPTDGGGSVHITSRRTIGPQSEHKACPSPLSIAAYACLMEIEAKIKARYPDAEKLHIYTPGEWFWCSSPQFVDPPVKMFFERSSAEGPFTLNMATVIAQ